MTIWKAVAVGLLALGRASAEPAATQDPPGEVDVRQPAGVSLPERNTEADVTDTLRGGGRTDAIEGDSAAQAGPSILPSEGRGDVEPGAEARASFEGGTGSAASQPEAAEADPAAEDTDESTFLGSDVGYGTATEEPPASPAR